MKEKLDSSGNKLVSFLGKYASKASVYKRGMDELFLTRCYVVATSVG